MRTSFVHVGSIGLDPPSGAIQTMANLVGRGTGKPIRRMLASALRSKSMGQEIESYAKSAIMATVYAAYKYEPYVYQRTMAMYNAVSWMVAPKQDRASPDDAAMMLTIKYRQTGYKKYNMALPKTNRHGTSAKKAGGGTYAKFFLPQFQPSFLVKTGSKPIRDFFSVWKATIPPVVIREVRKTFLMSLRAAKAGT